MKNPKLVHRVSNPEKTNVRPWNSVCASCDRVHSLKGWHKPAPGELNHSQITHDICPDCIRQLYPSYAHIADQLVTQASAHDRRRYL